MTSLLTPSPDPLEPLALTVAQFLSRCIAWVKRLCASFAIVLPRVTWRSRVESQASPDRTDHASTSPPLQAQSSAEENLALATAHLEYLGYEIRLNTDGWTHAQHPSRYGFHLRSSPQGIRLNSGLGIGAFIGNSRLRWLEFLNTASERGMIAQFYLSNEGAGRQVLRISAFVTGPYHRASFALVMDMWHHDLDLVRQKPPFLQEDEEVSEDNSVAVTVN